MSLKRSSSVGLHRLLLFAGALQKWDLKYLPPLDGEELKKWQVRSHKSRVGVHVRRYLKVVRQTFKRRVTRKKLNFDAVKDNEAALPSGKRKHGEVRLPELLIRDRFPLQGADLIVFVSILGKRGRRREQIIDAAAVA